MTPPTAQETASRYMRRGWAVIPVPAGSKNPGVAGWQTLRLTEDELDAFYSGGPQNVGVLLGEASGGLVDIDLDCPESQALADHFLPPTGAVFGRASTPRAHRLYRLETPIPTTKFRDPATPKGDARAMLVELRSTVCQTLVPPSVHPSGEAITWAEEGEPAVVFDAEFQTAVARLAAAALLARHWPAVGNRHDAALALAGSLLRAEWTEAEVTDFIRAITQAAGDDEPVDRARAALSSAQARDKGKPTTGWPTLARLIDPRVVHRVRTWLGIVDRPGAQHTHPSYEEFSERSEARLDAETRARALPVPPFPLAVFPPRVRRYLTQGAKTVGCPPDLLAVPFLGYAAAAIGRRRRLALKRRWERKATFWTGVVAASGDGKSPADAYARAALDRLQAEADARYQEQFTTFKRELARWKSADAAIRGDEPSPPLYEHWYTTDPTVEALAPMLQTSPGVAASFDELVAWAKGCNAYKRGGNDRQKYLEVWNGRPLKVDRRTQGVLYVPDPVLCIVGGIQPERLPELTREASVHDGLLPRFCWTYPDVTPSDWDWGETERDDLDAIVDLFQQLRSAPLQTIRPHPDARDRWAGWYDATKRSRRGLPPLAREVASKLPAHLATLWLVLHCLWDPKGTKEQASLATLERAIALVAYFQAHARRVLVHFGTTAPHVDAGLTQRVTTILQQAGDWLSKTELWEALHRNASAAALDAALGALLAEGRVEVRQEGSGTNKRTLWRWCDVNLSYELDEEDDVENAWTDEATESAAGSAIDSFASYEEFAMPMQLRLPTRCFACGSARFAADGVCLVCHPRPSGQVPGGGQ